MTFRFGSFVTLVAIAAASSGCGKQGAASGDTAGAKTADSAAGAIATDGGGQKTAMANPLPSNKMGKIPLLEYHVIGGEKNGLYSRTVASFKADLEDVYRRGYRPITVAQMLDKDFSDVPDGMSPVVFVFDDASPEQFRYIEQNGKLEIDPTSGMGIWLDFAKSHPG